MSPDRSADRHFPERTGGAIRRLSANNCSEGPKAWGWLPACHAKNGKSEAYAIARSSPKAVRQCVIMISDAVPAWDGIQV
ncbi:hypothetical protein [Aureliella helgolandensis]|uniref:hypothetical protein n=1 Tax=Aureliella helgolandensis TaxID=2527968 RepID=UPI0011A069BC|nr:hypothetical protein [Aureliella helgolandensis]